MITNIDDATFIDYGFFRKGDALTLRVTVYSLDKAVPQLYIGGESIPLIPDDRYAPSNTPAGKIPPFLWRFEHRPGTLTLPDPLEIDLRSHSYKEFLAHDVGVEVPSQLPDRGGPDPPRLVELLNQEMLTDGGTAPSDAQGLVQAILEHIFGRLTGGLDKIWLGPDLKRMGIVPLEWRDPDELGASDAQRARMQELLEEEAWARQVTEMLLCHPYAGPGETYFAAGAADNALYEMLMNPDDRAYPLVAACQHLCDLMAITRGHDLPPGPAGLVRYNAGPSSRAIVKQFGGAWREEKADAEVKRAIEEGFGPGGVYTFNRQLDGKNENDPDNIPHVGFALRVIDRKGARKLQCFDTGGLGATGRDTEVLKGGMTGEIQGGIFDDPPMTNVPGPLRNKKDGSQEHSKFTGWGSLPFRRVADAYGNAPDKGVPDVLARVREMRKARPLGLARLVIVSRDVPPEQRTRANQDKWLLFESPLLFMHYKEHVFPLSRLLWSLRQLPGRDRALAVWMVDLPAVFLNTGAALMLALCRPREQNAHLLQAVAAELSSQLPKTGGKFLGPRVLELMKGVQKSKKPEDVTKRRALIDLGVDTKGLVHILRRYKLPDGSPSRKTDKRDPDHVEYDSSERPLPGMGGVVKADGLTGLSAGARDYFTAGGGTA